MNSDFILPGGKKTKSCLMTTFAAANRWYITNVPDENFFSFFDANTIKCLKKCKVCIKGILGAYLTSNSVGIQLNGVNMDSFGYTGSVKFKTIDIVKEIAVGDLIKMAVYYGNTQGDLAISVAIDIL